MTITNFYRAFTLLALAFFMLLSCQENDDLYGNSPDDYQPTGDSQDQAANRYFQSKEIACITAKADVKQEMPTGYSAVSLINKNPNGALDQLLSTSNVFASMTFSYESLTGGIMRVTAINSLGYEKTFNLYPCNEKTEYFYIAEYEGTSLLNVYAFSIDPGEIPSAADLGHEAGLSSGDQIVGIGYQRSAAIERSVKASLGDVHYLANLLRNVGSCDNASASGNLFNSTQWMYRRCTGGTINDKSLDRFSAFLPVNNPWDAVELWTSSNENIQINSSQSPHSKRMRVYVYRDRRYLYSFMGWVEAKNVNQLSLLRIRM